MKTKRNFSCLVILALLFFGNTITNSATEQPTAPSPLPEIIQTLQIFADNLLAHGRVLDAKGQPTPLILDQVDIWTNSAPRPGCGVWPQAPRNKMASSEVAPEFFDRDFVRLLTILQKLLPSDYGAGDKRVEFNRYANAAQAYLATWPNQNRQPPEENEPDATAAKAAQLVNNAPDAVGLRLSAGDVASVIEYFCQRYESSKTNSASPKNADVESARPWVEVALSKYWANGYFVSGPTPGMETDSDPWRISSGRSGCSRLALALLRYELLSTGRSIRGLPPICVWNDSARLPPRPVTAAVALNPSWD